MRTSGRSCRSPHLPAALVGSALIYLAVRLGVPGVVGVGRATAGVFVSEFVFGLAWACLGYQFGRPRP